MTTTIHSTLFLFRGHGHSQYLIIARYTPPSKPMIKSFSYAAAILNAHTIQPKSSNMVPWNECQFAMDSYFTLHIWSIYQWEHVNIRRLPVGCFLSLVHYNSFQSIVPHTHKHKSDSDEFFSLKPIVFEFTKC